MLMNAHESTSARESSAGQDQTLDLRTREKAALFINELALVRDEQVCCMFPPVPMQYCCSIVEVRRIFARTYM
jgi:hypothetical protein